MFPRTQSGLRQEAGLLVTVYYAPKHCSRGPNDQ